jgi:hypothetical protein
LEVVSTVVVSMVVVSMVAAASMAVAGTGDCTHRVCDLRKFQDGGSYHVAKHFGVNRT